MISQRCPRCSSKRIRQGYKSTSLLLKVIFRYNLLCDNCNWVFTGFAIPGTVGRRKKRSSKSSPVISPKRDRENTKDKSLAA